MTPTLPILCRVDLVVVGGASAGVAAAAEAAREGRKVFLGATENYLGADICAPGRLWLAEGAPLTAPLARALFTDAEGRVCRPVRPMDIKRRLDEELLDSDVPFLFGCVPSDLLADEGGALAGVVFTGKGGPFAVTARAVIDATPTAQVARLAGLAFTPWPGGELTFSRVLIGHRASGDDGSVGEALGSVTGAHRGKPVTLEAFRYRFSLPVPAFAPEPFAAAEMTARERAWHPQVAWSSERLDWLPPDGLAIDRPFAWAGAERVDLAAFATSLPGLHVLGPCARLDRAGAAQMAEAPQAIAAGVRLGHALAARPGVVTVPCHPLRGGTADPDLHEPAQCQRFKADADGTVPAAMAGLPQLGSFDVVVVGGGTGGAPAAISAARAGARVLLLECLHDLGGVGTVGYISAYYHGYREGFTAEVTRGLKALGGNDPGFRPEQWNPEHKAEWFRRELRAAGAQVWFGTHVSGVRLTGSRVCGVIANTPWGRGVVRAGVVIDATGNADVAAAAGAACTIVSDADLAIQGTGLPSRPFLPSYHNTDYTFVDDNDWVDTTRAFVVARRRFRDAFDLAPLVDTRERRQIVGDVVLTPPDVYTGRTWSDSICLSRSNFDSHGFTVHPLFLVLPPDRTSLDAWLPLRALLPRQLSGVLVTGLAISGQRDVMPVYRMQPDIQNHAYAAGLAAVLALARKGEVRRIDVRALQRRLVALDILPQTVLLHRDAPVPTRPVLQSAATGSLDVHAELAALLAAPEPSRLLLRQRLTVEHEPVTRVACARLLAAMGDASGASVLIETLRAAPGWDTGWSYTGMGQFGRSLSPLDDCIMALALARVGEAKVAVLEKVHQLGADPTFSHVRAVSVFCETFPDADCAAALAEVLRLPGLTGHAWTRLSDELANIPPNSCDTTTRNASLRELYLARALWRCGDRSGVAAGILARYARDLRGHFARHARIVLAGEGRTAPRRAG